MFRAIVMLVTLLLTVTGCGNGEDGDDRPADLATARNGDVYGSADVAFATTTIPLHAEALAMVDAAMPKQLSPEARALADEIQQASTPEVEEMTSWLTSWDQPVPETVRDHVNAGHGDDHGSDGGGQGETGGGHDAASEDLAALEEAEGAAFEELWLDLLVANHEAALAAARTEVDEGTFEPAIELAESITVTHTDRLRALEALRG